MINFQLSRFDPGQFTINVGISVPEVAAVLYNHRGETTIVESECCLRHRLGELAGDNDLWWRLPAAPETELDIRLRLQRDGLPFLARFGTRDEVLRELTSAGNPGSPIPRITRAIILAARGDHREAESLLREQIQSSDSTRHREYVQEISERLGLGGIDL